MRYLLILLMMFISGCSVQNLNEKLSTPEDREIAEKSITLIREGKIEDLKPLMEEAAYQETLNIDKNTWKDFAIDGDLELVTVNSNVNYSDGTSVTNKGLYYQFGSGSQWYLYQVQLLETNQGPIITAWHLTPYNIKPTEAGDFSFEGKSFIHYFWIGAIIVNAIIIIFAVILAIRSKGIKRRWLWIIGCLIGFMGFSLNWSTGDWGFQLINIQLLGIASIKASPIDAWVLKFSLPIIATLFIIIRPKLLPKDKIDSIE